MNDYFLQTADEAAMRAALIETGVTDADGYTTEGHAVSVIGAWFERTGGTDEQPTMEQVPGWHFNVRAIEPIEWPATVTAHVPKTPWQVWL